MSEYRDSIISNEPFCYICGKSSDLQRHEIYHGAYRDKSKRLGCWVYLCRKCHIDKVHNKKNKDGINWDLYLKMNCYGRICEYYGWSDKEFRKEFGKSYAVL